MGRGIKKFEFSQALIHLLSRPEFTVFKVEGIETKKVYYKSDFNNGGKVVETDYSMFQKLLQNKEARTHKGFRLFTDNGIVNLIVVSEKFGADGKGSRSAERFMFLSLLYYSGSEQRQLPLIQCTENTLQTLLNPPLAHARTSKTMVDCILMQSILHSIPKVFASEPQWSEAQLKDFAQIAEHEMFLIERYDAGNRVIREKRLAIETGTMSEEDFLAECEITYTSLALNMIKNKEGATELFRELYKSVREQTFTAKEAYIHMFVTLVNDIATIESLPPASQPGIVAERQLQLQIKKMLLKDVKTKLGI